MAKVQVTTRPLDSSAAAVLALPVREDETEVEPSFRDIDSALDGALTDILRRGEFKPAAGKTHLVRTAGTTVAARVLLVGLGKPAEVTLETVRRATASAARTVRSLRARSWSAPVFPADGDAPARAEAMVEGASLGLYRFDRYRTGDDEPAPEPRLRLHVTAAQRAAARKAVERAEIMVDGARLARDLVNEPANAINPVTLAAIARDAAAEAGLQVQVLTESALARRGLRALCAVGQGSHTPPRVVILEHRPSRQTGDSVTLVGKGVTFDSGGLSLKTPSSMQTMKFDMAGAAAVLGAMQSIARLGARRRVIGILALVENMPGGSAQRPGDIVRTHSGKTVEILSTDAEGRLILADALSLAATRKPAAIVDFATLTGACITALGHECAGAMSNDDSLLDELRQAGERCGERVWPLPLWSDYEQLIRSENADIKNTGGKAAGAIAGGMFLKQFVGDMPWCHIDIAGVAWREKARGHVLAGGTGFGARLAARWVLDREA